MGPRQPDAEPPRPPFKATPPRPSAAGSSASKPGRHPRANITCQVLNQHGNQPLRWEKTGVVMESGDLDVYVVKVDGSGRLSKRTRAHLRPVQVYDDVRPQQMPELPLAGPPATDDQRPPTPLQPNSPLPLTRRSALRASSAVANWVGAVL